MDSSILMTEEEMTLRTGQKEDSFDLVIEKWQRIHQYLNHAFTRDDYVVALEASQVVIPFCRTYAAHRNCSNCPILLICQGEDVEGESLWSGLYRLLQAYGWAGDFLAPEPLLDYLGRFLDALKRANEPSV
ncbi:MAG: hypothetical protein HY788_16410 [Deltaproteobacteria bacterium]|nr:hypothetical protein [Deltaproteobacteria bacterium]